MASQKRLSVSLEKHPRNTEVCFSWSNNLPINGEAQNRTGFELRSPLPHEGKLQMASKPRRGFQSVPTRSMPPQQQGGVTKPLVPLIGSSESLSAKGNPQGLSVASSLALMEPMRGLCSSQGPTGLLTHGYSVVRTTERPAEGGSSTSTSSPASNDTSDQDRHAPPLAPQKVKDFQKLTHVSKRGLDHQFEKHQVMILADQVHICNSRETVIADRNTLQPAQAIDPQSSNVVLEKVSGEDGVVPEPFAGSQEMAMLEAKVKTEPHHGSAKSNHSSSHSSPSTSPNKKRLRDSVLVTTQGAERLCPRSRLLTSSAYAPIPVPAPVFSSGEPFLPSLIACSQSLLELTQPSTHSLEDSLQPPHIPPLHLQKVSCFQSLENRPKEDINSGKPLSAYQKRFIDLQAFLRLCDEADQMDLLQALRSFSDPARSGHAFNLETRALRLSVEEGKEMVRLKTLNVMGRSLSPKAQKAELGSTPIGVRLPAPSMPSCTTLDA